MSTKIAIITGASRGLGRATALHLARRGVAVLGTYAQCREAADETARLIGEAGGKAAMLPLDLSGETDFAAFAGEVARILERDFGRASFDYLVNNAGMGAHAPVLSTTPAQLDALVQVHLRGPLFLTQALASLIEDGGRILNVSSGVTGYVIPGAGVYAAVKAAVEVLSTYLAQELGARQIRVNVIAPGAVATDFGGGAVRDNRELAAMVAGMVALGRVAEADDIGKAAAAILSDDMAWVNGTRIDVSGGQRL